MSDDVKHQQGTTHVKSMVAVLASTGILGVIATGYMAVANDARIAITVAEQHGQEFLLLRGEITALREELQRRTTDRYTSRDHLAYERLMDQRLERLEEKIEGCMNATGASARTVHATATAAD